MPSLRLAIFTLLTLVTTAHAQVGPNSSVSFVASNGDDGLETCTTTQAPCRTIAAALQRTRVNGSVVCLTPVLAGVVQILRSVQINCPGTLVRGATANDGSVFIDIPVDPSDTLREVVLRGFAIESSSGNSRTNGYGILIRSAALVIVENITMNNARLAGIRDERTGGQTRLYVKDTTISNAGGPAVQAAAAAPGILVLDNVSMLNNLYGIAAASGNNITARNSVMSGNLQAGVFADGGARITLEGSTVTNNGTGIVANGTVRLLRTNASFNNTAVSGNATSLGGNVYSGNGSIGTTPSLATGAQADVFN